MPANDTEAEVDGLYHGPLAHFVEARNALAARLGTGGDAATAQRVRSLAKPSVPAWAANQVYWVARPEFDALSDAARRLRARQQATGPSAGTGLREAMRKHREALAGALKKAEAILAQAGYVASPATLHRIAATLEALAAEQAASALVKAERALAEARGALDRAQG